MIAYKAKNSYYFKYSLYLRGNKKYLSIKNKEVNIYIYMKSCPCKQTKQHYVYYNLYMLKKNPKKQ